MFTLLENDTISFKYGLQQLRKSITGNNSITKVEKFGGRRETFDDSSDSSFDSKNKENYLSSNVVEKEKTSAASLHRITGPPRSSLELTEEKDNATSDQNTDGLKG